MMINHCTTVGINLNDVLKRIEFTDLQIRALEAVLAEKRSQQHSDIETLDTHTCPRPTIPSRISAKVLTRCVLPNFAKSPHVLLFKEANYPCLNYYDWLTRSLRLARESYPNRWSDVVIELNSGCRTNLRVAQSLEHLLPNLTADLRRGKSESIGGGWYVSKESLDKGRIVILIKKLCEITGLKFGADVILLE